MHGSRINCYLPVSELEMSEEEIDAAFELAEPRCLNGAAPGGASVSAAATRSSILTPAANATVTANNGNSGSGGGAGPTGAFPYNPQCANRKCRYISVMHGF